MTIIFKAKTVNGYCMKILSELFQHNLKTAFFRINAQGIFLRMMDPKRRILIDLVLKANKFNFYKFKSPEENLFVGINLTSLHKTMKTIKKNDSVVWKIEGARPNNLIIRVIPKENPTRISESIIKIQDAQHLVLDLPDGYGKSVNLPSSDFQKSYKDVSSVGSNFINITSKGFQIKFSSGENSLIPKSVSFGEAEETDDDSDSEDEEETPYNQNYETDQLSKITKISSLGPHMQIYARSGLPLLFKTSVGHIGRISIYLRSKEQIEREKEESEDEEE